MAPHEILRGLSRVGYINRNAGNLCLILFSEIFERILVRQRPKILIKVYSSHIPPPEFDRNPIFKNNLFIDLVSNQSLIKNKTQKIYLFILHETRKQTFLISPCF